MNAVFSEGDLQITINNAVDARRFDTHKLSHCMKAVDFVVELDDRYLFIEFKDPDHPRSNPENRQAFMQEFQTGQIDEELKYKYRDSFLYEWAAGRTDKPAYFYVLIAMDRLTPAQLRRRTRELRNKLPVTAPASWRRPIVEDSAVFNILSWNQYFPDFPIVRLPPPSDTEGA